MVGAPRFKVPGMCGFAGFIENSGGGNREVLEHQATTMAASLVHRGPDSSGVWVNPDAGAAFSFRRLSIIDLTANGEQPMLSEDGRFVIVFNGEIYNYTAIRNVLMSEGVRFRSRSDTEVLLKACMHWGIERTIGDLVGMFAFALWDNVKRKLWIARDRLGIKPVYYGQIGNRFAFASELKALRTFKDWQPTIDPTALGSFVRLNHVPSPTTIYTGISKLEPGCILERQADRVATVSRYWNVGDYYQQPSLDISEEDAVAECERLLSNAVKQRLVSDVPLGALLSGGIDSSTVVALMNRVNKGAVRTFTIAFGDKTYNEADHAKKIAHHIGTNHTALNLSSDKALGLISKLPDIYDEPFADSSALPTYLVSQLAREHVTVALSGDGGDEVFFGYNRYAVAPAVWRKSRLLPNFLRKVGGCAIKSISPQLWDRIAMMVPQSRRPRTFGVKLHKLSDIIAENSEESIYRQLISHWGGAPPVLNQGIAAEHDWPGDYPRDFAAKMAMQDTRTYLPDDILTKVDRASMAVGLEVRVPLLDHRLVEFMARLPASLKQKNRTSKYLLRKVLRKYVPDALVDRPKMGFAVPLDSWLRGPLRDWAEDILDEKKLKNGGWFDPVPIRKAWHQHLAGSGNHQEGLWGILMAQTWLDRWG